MTTKPHQQRVIEEKEELDKKAYALSDFIWHNPEFRKLSLEESELLRQQNELMWQYSEVLEARIALFK